MSKPVFWGTFILFGITILPGFYLRSESWLGTTVRHPLQSDALEYFNYAHNLRYHHTYSREDAKTAGSQQILSPDAVRYPGYPLVLSLLIDRPPDRKLIKKIQLFQMLISTLTLVLSFFFFRCYLTPSIGGIAAIFVSLSPHLIIFNSYILSESLFCFMLVLLGLLWCGCTRYSTVWFSALIGAVMGMATLVRPSLQFFPLAVAGIFLFYYGRKKGLKLAAALILGFLLILSPWLIRNLVTVGKTSDNSLMINFLHHGMYPDFKFKQMPESYRRPYRFDPRAKAISIDLKSVLGEIKNRFRDEPLLHLKWFLLKKPAVFWSWDMIQGHGDMFVYYVSRTPYSDKAIFQWTFKMMHFLHGPLVILSFLGSFLIWIFPQPVGDNRNTVLVARIVAALLFYYTALHMVGAPFPRYSVPLRPFQYGMALFCLHMIYKTLINRFDVMSRLRKHIYQPLQKTS